jgi:hypothetical protein
MIKLREIQDASSCFNKAKDDERIFVLLSRDPAAPIAIVAWVRARIEMGKNNPDDRQILEALECARKMELERPLPIVDDRDNNPDYACWKDI